jgi:murein L,D-transpeptidase YcbB/YkuD
MRLQNLGFYARPSDPGPEARAEALRVAVLRFQRAQGLGDTGVVDDATRAALAKEHGS